MNITKKEDGNILVLFAFMFMVLVMFMGLTTDLALAYAHKEHLNEIANIMREARLDLGEEAWNSNYPYATVKAFSQEIGRQNGLRDDQVDIEWIEDYLGPNRRNAKVNVIITDTYHTSTLKMIGIHEIPIRVKIEGYQSKHNGAGVWHP